MVVKKLSWNNGSFPSGHTSSSFATATAIQQRWGWKAGFPAYLLASYAGITRLHQNHYLGDVAFGLERQFAKKVAAITTREDRSAWRWASLRRADRVWSALNQHLQGPGRQGHQVTPACAPSVPPQLAPLWTPGRCRLDAAAFR